jgi:hypothetical protein
MEKTHTYIEHKIQKKKQGEIIFPTDFRGAGTDVAINQAFSRLTKKGIIKRLSKGIYYIPKTDAILGELRPSADDVIKMIAEKEKIKIKPTGTNALHQLGLTTQVPTRRVYITNGHDRQFTLGKLQIKFKATTSKRLSRKGKISSLVILALEEIGTVNIDLETETKLQQLLSKENPQTLKNDLKLASAKVNNYILKIMKENIK